MLMKTILLVLPLACIATLQQTQNQDSYHDINDVVNFQSLQSQNNDTRSIQRGLSKQYREFQFPNSFQIQSTQTTRNMEKLCIEASDISVASNLKVQLCSVDTSKQIFTADIHSRIRLAENADLCLFKSESNYLLLNVCGLPSRYNMFVYNSFENALLRKKNGYEAVSVDGGEPTIGSQVIIDSSLELSEYKGMQSWILMTTSNRRITRELLSIPNQFQIHNMKPTSTGINICIEATFLGSGATLEAHRCDSTRVNQQWATDNFSRIHPVGNENVCIQQVGSSSALQLRGCGPVMDRLNGIMFNAFESTLLWKQNGFHSLFIEGDDATLGGKQIKLSFRRSNQNKETQQWHLESKIESINNYNELAIGMKEMNYVGNSCESKKGTKCGICEGDCDTDDDCEGPLRCAHRTSLRQEVPGCSLGKDTESRRSGEDDFCFLPMRLDRKVNYVGECNANIFLCKECEGDCDRDEDCEGDLICMQRDGLERVSGCMGAGGSTDMYGKDICVKPDIGQFKGSLLFNENGCDSTSQCQKCEGSCGEDADCRPGLSCFLRSGLSSVPGCVTGGSGDVSNLNYCYERPDYDGVSYVPGDLTIRENQLLLSTGLKSRVIARAGEKVRFSNGSFSRAPFHANPDGAAIFQITRGEDAGGYIYVSNSEANEGGVGAITFNSSGGITKYEMIVTSTQFNCGGGKTYWGTWVTCEEHPEGQVYEVDPLQGISTIQKTILGGSGGSYESFAYDARDPSKPTFYVTHDAETGGMVRFTPNAMTVAAARQSGDYSKVLTTKGKLQWLVLSPADGTFFWSNNRLLADNNAKQYYQNSEGIDIRDGLLYFTAKLDKYLFILDLDNQTYEQSSTISGAFDGQPDQVARIITQDPVNDMLYFCEDSGNGNGVHARDTDGNYYTIVTADSLDSETTGLAFSPDNKHMYISYQHEGLIFDITRTDGQVFGGHRLDIKYHTN